jgi:hypothetical protein
MPSSQLQLPLPDSIKAAQKTDPELSANAKLGALFAKASSSIAELAKALDRVPAAKSMEEAEKWVAAQEALVVVQEAIGTAWDLFELTDKLRMAGDKRKQEADAPVTSELRGLFATAGLSLANLDIALNWPASAQRPMEDRLNEKIKAAIVRARYAFFPACYAYELAEPMHRQADSNELGDRRKALEARQRAAHRLLRAPRNKSESGMPYQHPVDDAVA